MFSSCSVSILSKFQFNLAEIRGRKNQKYRQSTKTKFPIFLIVGIVSIRAYKNLPADNEEFPYAAGTLLGVGIFSILSFMILSMVVFALQKRIKFVIVLIKEGSR